MGVTYQQLLAKGMNAQIMYYFDFTLAQWVKFGMRRADVTGMSEGDCLQVFAVQKEELVLIFDEFANVP
jgi:hypothetical protein